MVVPRHSLGSSKTEVMEGTTRHVTVMDIAIRTVCALPQAGIEIGHALALRAAIDVVMLAPLVVAIVLCMETLAVETRGAKAEEVEAANIDNEARKTATVGVIALVIRSCRLQVQRSSSLTIPFPLTISRVSVACIPTKSTSYILTIHAVLSRTLFVGGVTQVVPFSDASYSILTKI